MLVIVILATPQISSAYKVSIHSQLTKQTLSIYNQLYNNTFSQSDIASIAKGAVAEDDGQRPTRHFYDPISKKGLLGDTWLSARVWAQDTLSQSKEGINLWDSDKLYSDKTDYSWDRAIYEYVYGSRARAMESLGHILHLVQDTTVPAHVRDDDHLSKWGIGDVNLYEEYTAKVKPSISVISYPYFATFDELYVSSANFTNKNFLSKDTIFNNYTLPKREGLELERSFADGSGQYFGTGSIGKLVRIERLRNRETGKTSELYGIDDKQKKILANYYKILSNKAGEYGVATVNTFLAAVADEQKTSRLKYMNLSRDEVEVLVDLIDDARGVSFFSNIKLAKQKLKKITKKEWAGYKAAAEIYGIELPEYRYMDDEPEREQVRRAPEPPTRELPQQKPEQKPKQKVEIPKEAVTPTFDYLEMQQLLSQLQRMLESYAAQQPSDRCTGIDLSIIKYSTCLSPFEEGGYAYGAGGLGEGASDGGSPPSGDDGPPGGPPGCGGCVF